MKGYILTIKEGAHKGHELRLPLLVAVGVLNTNKTFPVASSFCPSESAESISFVWKSLKEEDFVDGICEPRVVLGGWAGELIASVPMGNNKWLWYLH